MTITTLPCIVCHKTTQLDVDPEKLKRWQKGEHIQDVFTDWDADKRELLITGTHPECWDLMMTEGDWD